MPDGDDPPQTFVTVKACEAKHIEVDKMSLALFGSDGRGGMVKDVQEIKTRLESATGVVKTWVVPIVVAVVTAVIVVALKF